MTCNSDGKAAYHLGDVLSPFIPPGDALRNEVRQLVEGIRTGKPPIADGYADRHWHPGDGEVNWRAIFTAISKLPQLPRLIIEVRDQAGVRRGVDYLRAAGLAQ